MGDNEELVLPWMNCNEEETLDHHIIIHDHHNDDEEEEEEETLKQSVVTHAELIAYRIRGQRQRQGQGRFQEVLADACISASMGIPFNVPTKRSMMKKIGGGGELEGEGQDEDEDEDEHKEHQHLNGFCHSIRPTPVFGSHRQNRSIAWKWGKKEAKVYNNKEPFNVIVEGKEQQPFVDLFFKTAYKRNDNGSICSRLVLDEVQFGVHHCLNESRERGHFVYRMEIEAKPSDSWSTDCIRMAAPKPAPAPIYFEEQSTRLCGLQISAPMGISLIGERSRGISYNAPSFGWSPAKIIDLHTAKSVKWNWGIHRWNDGTKFKVKRSSKVGVTSIPKLPSQLDPQVISFGSDSFVAEAFWEVMPNTTVETYKMEWNIQVTLYTAYFRQGYVLPKILQYQHIPKKGEFKIDSTIELVLDQ